MSSIVDIKFILISNQLYYNVKGKSIRNIHYEKCNILCDNHINVNLILSLREYVFK